MKIKNEKEHVMKYTVLVVDDEVELRHALVEKVDWEAAEFEVIGEAENGVEALDVIETLEPDLIITDIKMPMISGLELARQVREMRPATQIVFLSGYDSFEYARTAIDYNVISYLLKPISSEEMSHELFEIHRKMDEKIGNSVKFLGQDLKIQLERTKVSEFLMPLMLGSNESQLNEEELLSRAEELKIIGKNAQNSGFCVMVSKFKDGKNSECTSSKHVEFISNVMSKYLKNESFVVYGRAVTLLVLNEDKDPALLLDLPLKEIVQSSKRLLNQTCTIGVSREFKKLSACSDAYFQAVTARRYTSDGNGEVRFINDQENDTQLEFDLAEKMTLSLEQLLKVGTKQSLDGFINGLYESNTPENANLLVMQIIATVYRVVSAVSDKNGLMKLIQDNPLFSRMTSYSSENFMKTELLNFCMSAKSIIESSQKRDSEVLCDRVVEIIDKNFTDEELSLTAVSNELAVSPNYLSALIKKTKGKNFITLLTERRMKAAYDMIVCSSLKMLEISEKCGYSDQHYFSYCFKKFYGESPNKLRQSREIQ